MPKPTILIALVVSLVAGCAEDPPPSCQQAIGHYYQAGCSYYDLNSGAPIAAATMIANCQGAAAEAPAQCQDELDEWLVCNNEVPDHSTTNAQCDCSQALMSLLACR